MLRRLTEGASYQLVLVQRWGRTFDACEISSPLHLARSLTLRGCGFVTSQWQRKKNRSPQDVRLKGKSGNLLTVGSVVESMLRGLYPTGIRSAVRRSLMLGLALVLFQAKVHAQQFPFRNYMVRDGLMRDAVRSIFQDSGSWLWIATTDGVDRYGGGTFTHYTTANGLAADFVNDISEDSSGTIWFGTNFAGISSFRDGHFTNYLVDSASSSSPANTVNRILADEEGRLWLATGRGVYIFAGGRFITIDDRVAATSIQFDGSGTCWIGTTNGLMRVDRSEEHFFLSPAGDPGEEVTALACSADGLLWIGSTRGLRVCATNRGKSVLPRETELARELKGRRIRSIMAEKNNTVWIGTSSAGVVKMSEGKLTRITESNGLAGNTVYEILRDRESNVWFATARGLSRLISEQIVNYARSEGLPDHDVLSIGQDNFGGMWFATERAVSRLSNGIFVTFLMEQGHSEDYPVTLFTDKSRTVWCRTETGLHRVMFRKGIPYVVPYGSEENHKTSSTGAGRTSALYQDDGGNLWSANDSVINALIGGKFFTHVVENPTENRVVSAMMRDNAGDLWVGLHNGGIMRYGVDTAASTSPWLQLKERIGKIGSNGMRNENIRCGIRTRQGELWFGTRFGGVVRLQLKNGRVLSVSGITAGKGLASNWVNDIIQDNRGNIWLATSHGINKLEFADDSGGSPVIRTITIDDGLAGDGANSVYEDDRGILWFGTNGGVTRYDPSKEKRSTIAPPVYITKFSVSGRPDSAAMRSGAARLDYDFHSVGFEFIAVSFRGTARLRYQYKLEGFDSTWSSFTDQHYAGYTHLPAGRYVFKVRAADIENNWSTVPATFEFTVTPPFWSTWWFLLLTALAVAATGGVVQQFRVRHAIAMERLRLRIASDLHDDIGSTLSSIVITSELARKDAVNNPSIEEHLSRITANSRSILEQLDDIVWTINPRKDTLDDILLRMKKFAAEIFEQTGVECEMELPGDGAALKIPMEKRRHFYLIYKEAVNNALNHSGCSRACIQMKYSRKDSSLILVVEDNGRGFESGEAASGNGIGNMRRRARLIGATLEISSSTGCGTSVRLSFPLP